jgi:hypothetical protein
MIIQSAKETGEKQGPEMNIQNTKKYNRNKNRK